MNSDGTDLEPVVDPSQDYVLISGYENVTHTVLRFRRKLDTCDTSYDVPITVGETAQKHAPTASERMQRFGQRCCSLTIWKYMLVQRCAANCIAANRPAKHERRWREPARTHSEQNIHVCGNVHTRVAHQSYVHNTKTHTHTHAHTLAALTSACLSLCRCVCATRSRSHSDYRKAACRM